MKEDPQTRLRPLAVFLLYFAVGRLGLLVPFTSGNVSPVWPSAGVALALLLLWGPRLWPAIAAAAFLVNLSTSIPLLASISLGLGNAGAALAGAVWLRRIGGTERPLATLRQVVALVVVGAAASTMIAATVGTTALFLAGVRPWTTFGAAWQVWWLGDAMGVLLVAPVLLTLLQPKGTRGAGAPELAALLTSAALVCLLVFGRALSFIPSNGLPALAVFPFVVWGAIRFGVAGASGASALIALATVLGTAFGSGPFAARTPFEGSFLMQFFLAVISVTGLILGAVINERKQAVRAMRDLSGRLLRLQDDERRRLVRELHDSTGQSLTALMMTLAAARNRAPAGDEQTRESISRGIDLAEHVIKEIRTLCCLLHPPSLDEMGLASALRWYAESLEKRGGLKIELIVPPGLGRLSQDLETALFRIVQESLTNIVRHSGSPTATIRLADDSDRIRLTVRDRGRGLGQYVEGVGIAGMRERARELGGKVSVRSVSPGALVEASFPHDAGSSRPT